MGRAEDLCIIQIKASRRKPPPLSPVLVKQTDSHVSPKFVLLGFCWQHGPVHAHKGFSPVSGELASHYKIKKCVLWSPFAASLFIAIPRGSALLQQDASQQRPSAGDAVGQPCHCAAQHRLPARGCLRLPSCLHPARCRCWREVGVTVLWVTVPWVTVPWVTMPWVLCCVAMGDSGCL